MKAFASSSGGVMFVEDAIIRETNKQSKTRSYKNIVGEDAAEKKPIREKIFGVFVKKKQKAKAA